MHLADRISGDFLRTVSQLSQGRDPLSRVIFPHDRSASPGDDLADRVRRVEVARAEQVHTNPPLFQRGDQRVAILDGRLGVGDQQYLERERAVRRGDELLQRRCEVGRPARLRA